MSQGIRINKFLGDLGICSRREGDRLVEAGKVSIDGVTAVAGVKVMPGQKVAVDGKTVGSTQDLDNKKPVLIAVNKPRGIVCTTTDNDKAENIVDFIDYPTRIYPVGRLDKESEGLILMTNQGELVNAIMKAVNGHEKEYIVKVDKPMTPEFIEKMKNGVTLEELNITTRPCKVYSEGIDKFRIVLTQGLNRQIRRMCDALGYKVWNLKRIRIMNINLDKLEIGRWRDVTPEEFEELKKLTDER